MLTEGEQLRTLAKDKPLQMPVTTIGSRGGEFTYAAFRGVTTHEVTALQLDGVGHYVAQEAPQPLADRLLEVSATSAPAHGTTRGGAVCDAAGFSGGHPDGADP
jgi:hypothetical protein